MRWRSGLLFYLLIAFGIAGCGPAISEKDMGTVIYEIPRVKGADKPYEMPELGPTNDEHTIPNDVEEE